MDQIITIPFGYLLDWLYQFTSNYGVALILFAVTVQLVLLPITAKSKKSMMKMSRLQPRIQEIQKKYANDQQKQNEAIQQLQKEEGATMGCGGCLWSLIPMFILLPLYYVVCQPLVYILHLSKDTADTIVEIIKAADPSLFGSNINYHPMIAARHIPEFLEEITAKLPDLSERVLQGMNFDFLNIDLGAIPVFNVFDSQAWAWDWPHIGAFLIPVLSAGSQMVSMWLSQKRNDSLVTDEKGLQDKETAKNSQAAQTSKMMMWTMPLFSLWIGFSVPAALSLYWFIGGVARMIEDPLLTNHYRKIYDAEDAIRLQKALEADRIEAEKERVRAERRAANPEGQTQNTSKKKLQKQQQLADEAAKAAAAKEYHARKGIVEEEEASDCLSGISERPYCKGRAYDPNRYGSDSTEE